MKNFTPGQIVRGAKCGKFVVVSCYVRSADNCEVAVVKEIYEPTGDINPHSIKLPTEVLVAE